MDLNCVVLKFASFRYSAILRLTALRPAFTNWLSLASVLSALIVIVVSGSKPERQCFTCGPIISEGSLQKNLFSPAWNNRKHSRHTRPEYSIPLYLVPRRSCPSHSVDFLPVPRIAFHVRFLLLSKFKVHVFPYTAVCPFGCPCSAASGISPHKDNLTYPLLSYLILL